jgi:hypothetical protein
MEAKAKRHIEDGAEFDSLFPRANLTNKTEKRWATVRDTVRFIPKVVERTRWQTKALAGELKGDSLRDTCRNIWNFCYRHIRYQKDEEGLEQIRSPARSWHDRKRGIDCDCFTTLISTILTNLKIPHRLRITKYKQDHFQHIYPVVPTEGGDYITIDCVVDKFDYEEPFSEKKDTNMDLQYLDGLGSEEGTLDQNLGSDLEMEGLGKFNFRDSVRNFNVKDALKKGLFITNRVNPATVTLRNGLLAAMKINMFKLGSMMKWAYITEADAIKRGINMGNWKRLVKVKDKLEQIFYTAGGKPENLKKAILKGRGNRNHEVQGLGYVPDHDAHLLDEKMTLRKVLGEEIFHSENVEGMEEIEGIGELGEPYTAASIAAATGVLGAIAALIKKIGAILPKKDKSAKDFEPADAKNGETTLPDAGDKTQIEDHMAPAPDGNSKTTKAMTKNNSSGKNLPATGNSSGDSGGGGTNDNGDKPPGFWEKNKKWLKPTLWITGGLTAAGTGYEIWHSHKKKKEEEAKKAAKEEKTVSGVKPKTKRSKARSRRKKKTKVLM